MTKLRFDELTDILCDLSAMLALMGLAPDAPSAYSKLKESAMRTSQKAPEIITMIGIDLGIPPDLVGQVQGERPQTTAESATDCKTCSG